MNFPRYIETVSSLPRIPPKALVNPAHDISEMSLKDCHRSLASLTILGKRVSKSLNISFDDFKTSPIIDSVPER